MPDVLIHWLHLLAAVAWIGPQLFLLFILVPSLGTLQPPIRRALVKVVAARVNAVAWGALAVLLLSGGYSLLVRSGWGASLGPLLASPYGTVLLAKLALVLTVAGLTAWHAFGIGPRLMALPLPEGTPNPEFQREERRLRRLSVLVSGLNLLLSLAILWLAAWLRLGA